MSTSGQALTQARKIQEAMRDYGVNCIIQLRQGASRSGWLTPMSTRVGVMSHHIVSARTHGTTPFYNLVRNGRPGIPGPLANGYGGWDKVYRIITMGWANHPGAGGPITLAGRRVPRDNGRPYFWGTEYEGGLRASDWARDDYHGWMATCNAALLDVFNLPTSAHLEHLTWAPGRKIDRLGYTTASGRTRIAAVLGRTKADPTTPRKDWLDMDANELNQHLSRHAENVHRSVVRDLPGLVAEAVATFTTNTEPRSLWTMLRRATDAAQATNRALPGLVASIDADDVAQALLGPLSAELRTALEEAHAEAPDANDDQIATLVVDKIAARLNQEG